MERPAALTRRGQVYDESFGNLSLAPSRCLFFNDDQRFPPPFVFFKGAQKSVPLFYHQTLSFLPLFFFFLPLPKPALSSPSPKARPATSWLTNGRSESDQPNWIDPLRDTESILEDRVASPAVMMTDLESPLSLCRRSST